MSLLLVRFVLVFAFLGGSFSARSAAAADTSSLAIPAAVSDSLHPHVRTNEQPLAALLRRAAAESPSFESLVARLTNSNLIVYVRTNRLLSRGLDGQLTFMGTAGGRRYIVVSLAWGLPELRQMATLGHELQHAVEIAERPEIVDAATLARSYAAFGQGSTRGGGVAFETGAAMDTGERVWREISRRTRNGATDELEPAARP